MSAVWRSLEGFDVALAVLIEVEVQRRMPTMTAKIWCLDALFRCIAGSTQPTLYDSFLEIASSHTGLWYNSYAMNAVSWNI